MEKHQIRLFETRWRFARRLNLDLLQSLDEGELLLNPCVGVGPLWKQFRHIGRVQENYLTAVDTGRITFTCEGLKRKVGPSKQDLMSYLTDIDNELTNRLTALNGSGLSIEWPDETIDLTEHLMRLCEHELLHQGMFVASIQSLGKRYPKSWMAWGL